MHHGGMCQDLGDLHRAQAPLIRVDNPLPISAEGKRMELQPPGSCEDLRMLDVGHIHYIEAMDGIGHVRPLLIRRDLQIRGVIVVIG